jgi:glucose/arabinose dehydrogenase
MRRVLVATLAVTIFVSAPAAAQPTPPEVRTVVQGSEFVTGIAFTSDGRMVFNERPGRVRIIQDGVLRDEPIAKIETTTDGEAGLLGIAAPEDTKADPGVYVFATAPDGASNRVLRVPLDLADPEVVVEGLPAGLYHNGGGLAFAGDGSLLVSNGEQHESSRAQDPDALGGKVYRFTPTGDVPEDNPFGPSPAYAIGLRNPYGLAVDPVSKEAFATENGPESDDEVNLVVAGGNYGWPEISGPAGDGASDGLAGTYEDPLLNYPDIIVPTGIAFADPREARSPWRGNLFFAAFGQEVIHRVVLDESRTQVVSDEVFVDVGEPIIALAWGPQGLYFSTPEAINVVPIARGAGPPDPVIRVGSPDEGPLGGRNPVVLVVFTAIVVFVFYRTRRRFADAEHPRPGDR